jgi:L-threonylcarbamoyladenylate synthase
MPILKGDAPESIEQAVLRLQEGGLVALPTETVYGLGARADVDAAVAQIFKAKGRPASHPLIVHVANASAAAAFTPALSASAQKLIQAFWPGPLTVVVQRHPHIANAAAGGQNTIALRCPAHPVAQRLLQSAANQGIPGIAAPSANRFGRISPTTAWHVQAEFGSDLMVLDGGACAVGIESVIVDVSRSEPVLLRPGVLTRTQIEAVLGRPLQNPDDNAPRASGTLAAHYAPRARLRLMSASMLQTAINLLGIPLTSLAVYSRSLAHWQLKGLRCKLMPGDAKAAAQDLFAALRELDADGVELIWVEQPPESPEWAGVLDRLQRAASASDEQQPSS